MEKEKKKESKEKKKNEIDLDPELTDKRYPQYESVKGRLNEKNHFEDT